MNHLTAWFTTVVIGFRRDLTDAQLAGEACALCGEEFVDLDYHRVSFGWIGLPLRRRAYACVTACYLETVDEVSELFRAAIPPRQQVDEWHLGIDDEGYLDPELAASLEAQLYAPVVVIHPRGALTTLPLPLEYAERIAAQAQRLGFTASITEGSVAR
jgi:hypothetical protein